MRVNEDLNQGTPVTAPLPHLLRPAATGARRIFRWNNVFCARGRKADFEEEILDVDAGKFAFWNSEQCRPT